MYNLKLVGALTSNTIISRSRLFTAKMCTSVFLVMVSYTESYCIFYSTKELFLNNSLSNFEYSSIRSIEMNPNSVLRKSLINAEITPVRGSA